VFALTVAVCHCGVLLPHHARFAATPLLHGAPLAVAAAPASVINTEFDPLPQYTYAYNIQDSITGDYKSQQETRDGDVVKGKKKRNKNLKNHFHSMEKNCYTLMCRSYVN
jgi:hypothetical protein